MMVRRHKGENCFENLCDVALLLRRTIQVIVIQFIFEVILMVE
jgi:hypothetical protein